MRNKIILIMPRTGPSIIEPPFGLLCLSASLRKQNLEPVIWDSRFDDYKCMFDKHDKQDILAIGLTVMTGPQINHALKISRFIKKQSNIAVIWGGIHPTLLPEQTLEEPSIDYIVMGYGEIALPALLKALAENTSPAGIPNIAYKNNGRVVVNVRNDEVFNTPLVYDWDAVDLNRYLQSNYRFGNKVLSVFTSNGCPYNCTFCYGKDFHSKKWRAQSCPEVLEDIDRLKKRCAFDVVYFHDDNFFVDKERALSIIKGMKSRGIPFGLAIRADYADDALIRDLKHCGCVRVDWGTESGSQRILDYYKKGITVRDIENTAVLTAKYDIEAYTTILMGHPEETTEEMIITMDLIDKMLKIHPRLSISDIKILTPYPGSEFCREAVKKGYVLPASLAEWGRYFWNTTNKLSIENKRFLNVITIVSLLAFCEYRIRKNNILYNFMLNILHKISVFRWKHRYFKYPVEIYLCRIVLNVINRF
ncbi:MAG: radical SAM protein [bacterium]